MGFFTKSNRAVNHFFKKTGRETQNFFKKNGEAERGLRTTSTVLRKTGNTLQEINNEAGKVLNNPMTTVIASGLGPEGLAGLTALRGVNQAVGLSSNLALQGSALTNKNNYHGSAGNVVNSVLERSSNIAKTGATGKDIQFS